MWRSRNTAPVCGGVEIQLQRFLISGLGEDF